jgi:hypothetical protein
MTCTPLDCGLNNEHFNCLHHRFETSHDEKLKSAAQNFLMALSSPRPDFCEDKRLSLSENWNCSKTFNGLSTDTYTHAAKTEMEVHGRMARGGHGLFEVSLGLAIPNLSTPYCGQATPETALRPFQG